MIENAVPFPKTNGVPRLLGIAVALVLVAQFLSASPPAAASAGGHWNFSSNGQQSVKLADDGYLLVGSSASGSWTRTPFAGQKNKISSVIWDGKFFVATTYFGLYFSRTGSDWKFLSLPTGDSFSAGHIISNQDFFNSDAMNQQEIQSFFDSKVKTCTPGYVCLKDYSARTTDKPKTALCEAFVSQGRETAAKIIDRVARACGISQQVLVVLLQKEQGLVTHTWPSPWRFEKATGYACPDTAPCNAQYFGFFNQVYNAAKQFKRYTNPPGTTKFFTWYPVGGTVPVRYHPNVVCGSSPVRIENQATALLYYYTPYMPNRASAVSYSGSGDACSSYGNRNFWRYFNTWFASDKEFSNWGLFSNGSGVVVDHEGSALNVDLLSQKWSRSSNVPTSPQQSITAAGLGSSGGFVVERSDGKQFVFRQGLPWGTQSTEPLTAPGVSEFIATSVPVVSGEVVVGEALTVVVPEWDPQPAQFGYQWLRNGKLVGGATGSIYVLTKADVGKRVSVRVSGVLEGYLSTVTVSEPTVSVLAARVFVATSVPVVSGEVVVGEALTVVVPEWDPQPAQFGYQWLRNGKLVGGATGSIYVLTKADVGKRVSVRVSGVLEGYQNVKVLSSVTSPIAP